MTTRAPGGGRKPVPTNLRVLRGNPGRRPLNSSEARPKTRLPSPPHELSDAAKREWRRTGKRLLEAGLMTELDEAIFAAYCTSYARWLETQALLAKTPVLIKTADGMLRPNPLLRVVRETQEQFTRALAEFGMSPSSRSRVHALPKEEHADPFEEWARSG